MIFVINDKKYDTDKMKIMPEKCKNTHEHYSPLEAESLLMKYDLNKYEEIFGELEEG